MAIRIRGGRRRGRCDIRRQIISILTARRPDLSQGRGLKKLMYSKHFGFEALPFSVTPDPRFFYSTEIYQDVLAGLEHGIDAKSAFIVVTGEVGTGKTTLLRRLIYCSADKVDYAFIN